jgi:hypothetical protein
MPKTTEELYQELLAQGQQYQQQANDLLTQYDNRPAFSYNADTDPIYQSVRDQYVHQGQRAMEDTMGQAAGLTGGYGSSYSQSVGNQAYNEYLTKLNAQIPVLAQQARQAYDAEGQRMLDRYNLALNAANTAYGQSRDALGDLRYEDELNYNRQQSELNSARDYPTYLLGMGIMPSAEQLAAAGMTPQEAAAIQAYYRNQMALAAGGGSGSGSRSSSGSRRSSSGGGGDYGYNYTGDGDGDGNGSGKGDQAAFEAARNAVLQAAMRGSGYAEAVNALNKYGPKLSDAQGKMIANMLDDYFPNGKTNKQKAQAMAPGYIDMLGKYYDGMNSTAQATYDALHNNGTPKKKKSTGGASGGGSKRVAAIM